VNRLGRGSEEFSTWEKSLCLKEEEWIEGGQELEYLVGEL
jgi:hypothetical protein